MSQFGAPRPTPVTESTAIEIQRKEGSARSALLGGFTGTSTIPAGTIVKLMGSGLIQTVGTEDPQDVFGVTLYQGVSGSLATTIRGRVRCFFDGVNSGGASLAPGTELQLSYTYSGSVTLGNTSGAIDVVGFYSPFYGGTGAPGGAALSLTTNSGQLIPVELF